MQEADELVEMARDLQYRLGVLTVASCSCGVKSPEPFWHSDRCPYRVAREALEIAVEIERKIRQ